MPPLHVVILAVSFQNRELHGPPRLERQRQAAREALARSCAASGVASGPFEKDERDVPLPFHGIYWSLSHKSRYVAAVVSSRPVGIDIEEILPRKEALYRYIAEETEWALVGSRDWGNFFRYWTAKEAVLKATGAGLKDLKKTRIHAVPDTDHLLVDYEGHHWHVQHYRFTGHIVSLTHEGEVTWTIVE